MLLIYLLEGDKDFAPVVRDVMERSFEREDTLLTSHLSIAETLVGLKKGSGMEKVFLETIEDIGFELVPFGAEAVEPFRFSRQEFGLQAPDAMHLACAAAVKVDLFLTGDEQLLGQKIHVPGIQFIADFLHPPF
jgi:predicted nucleic acid-binding protein